MSERQKQAEFLKSLISLASPAIKRELQERIEKAEHDETCVRAAFTLVSLFGGFAIAGLAYCSVLHPEFFDNSTPTLVKIFCALALGSVICMLVFLCCWLWYRSVTNRL